MTMFGKRPATRPTEVPAWARALLLLGERPERGEEGNGAWVQAYFFGTGDAIKALWSRHGRELLGEWVAEHPGTRPWGWWEFDAPGPRQKVGGSGVLYDHGQAVAGFDLPGDGFWDVDPDPADPPQFEAQAAYLKRHGLLTPEERRRLKARDFKPELLAVDAVPTDVA